MSEYIYERPEWPHFTWQAVAVDGPLGELRLRQGRLLGRMESLGFSEQNEVVLKAATQEVVKSSEIEGESLDARQVRSSIARRLGMDAAGLPKADRRVDGVVEMALEATANFSRPLTRERLWRWHTLLFTAPPSGMRVGSWRDDSRGPMQVVSGGIGSERVHFQAPPAARLDAEMAAFLAWANGPADPLLRAALAHLWFVTVHPLDDGNGRVARAIADWALARSESSARRFYSMSAQIRKERQDYYGILERTQAGSLDVTEWILWFLDCLSRAIEGAETSLAAVFEKGRFWKTHAGKSLNARQAAMLNRVLDGEFKGKLTSSKWAQLSHCSQDTAHRDILALVELGILLQDPAGGRSTSYSLRAA
jgi:Fic family protein